MAFFKRAAAGGGSAPPQGTRGTLHAPEMKVFWISLPFLVTIAVISYLSATLYFLAFTAALVVIVGIIIFFNASSLARSNREVELERGELQNIVYNLDDALLVYGEGFVVRFFNPAAEKLFGLKSQDIVGRMVAPQDVHTEATELLAQVFFPSLAPLMTNRSQAGSYPQVVDLSFEDRGLELRVTTNAISDPRGRALGFMKIIRDRTRDVSILKSKSEFITVASHQLRTPLTGINWAMTQLAEDSSISDVGKEVVAKTREATRQVLEIVEELLRVSKIEEGRFGYSFEKLDYAAFVGDLLEMILPQARAAGVEVYFDKPQEPIPTLTADRQKIAMVFENLLDNALRYNVKGGSITIKLEKMMDSPYLVTSVHDTGIGIPQEDYEKVFTKFYRAENALKYETEGSGLGLYIVRNIVRAHGGKVWFESEVGRGTIIYFTLPLDPNLIPPKEVAVGP